MPNNFDVENRGLYDEMIKAAKEMHNIDIDDKGLIEPKLSANIIKQMLEKPKDLEIDSRGQLVVEIDGERIIIDPKESEASKMPIMQDNVTKVLNDVSFDVDGDGNKRISKELASAFKVCTIDGCLGNFYKTRIEELTDNYDFEKMADKDRNSEAFSDLLKLIQKDSGPVGRFLNNCCSIILTASKEKMSTTQIGIVSYI